MSELQYYVTKGGQLEEYCSVHPAKMELQSCAVILAHYAKRSTTTSVFWGRPYDPDNPLLMIGSLLVKDWYDVGLPALYLNTHNPETLLFSKISPKQ
jgi:hypothetical protein